MVFNIKIERFHISNLRPFHLAIPVYDINQTKDWYIKYLKCKVGRESKEWIDFNFFGHQLTAHLTKKTELKLKSNIVDTKNIPISHFGIILKYNEWLSLSEWLIKLNTDFIINPYTRFKGKVGEQSTMFITDPSNNYLEFKSFKSDSNIFKK